MLVVVGGHSRNIGKTSVLAGLICALPEWEWTAMKITQTGHGVCSSEGHACDCAPTDLRHPYMLSEEYGPSTDDSGRFLAAGAVRSFWLRTAAGQLGHAVPLLRKILDTGANLIVESNSILQFFKPDVYLVVMDFSREDFKPSSLRFLDRAHALIVVDSGINVPVWKNVSRGLWDRKRQFVVKPPYYVTAAIAAFVRTQLSNSPGSRSGRVEHGAKG
jgi:hypothetical protein